MPKKVALLTGWVTVGTAGKTIDGRTIEDAWLDQMAKNYSCDEYTAVINSEHMLGWYGSFGQVRALRTAKDNKGRAVLQARLEPNDRLLYLSAMGQHLFLSMEIATDYCASGEAYLVGLALTDNPASVGTTELRFSKAAENNQYRSEAIELDAAAFATDEDNGDEKDLLARLCGLIGRAFATRNEEKEDGDMKEEQFKQLVEGQEKMSQGVQGLTDLLTKQFAQEQPAGDGGTGNGGETAATPEAPAGGEDFTAQFKALHDSQTKLTEGFEELAGTLKKALEEGNGTQFATGQGAAGSEGDDVI